MTPALALRLMAAPPAEQPPSASAVPPDAPPARSHHGVGLTRDLVTVIGGAALLANETFLVAEPRAVLVGAALALLGIPTAAALLGKR